jgi:HEAT repeat protein
MNDQDARQPPKADQPAAGDRSAGQEISENSSRYASPDLNGRLAHFIQLLTDDNEVTRWKAAEVLGRIGDPAATEALIDTLWDDDSRVRLKAAWALGRIGDQRALRPLQRLYRMENEDAREIITEALEEIKHRMSQQ